MAARCEGRVVRAFRVPLGAVTPGGQDVAVAGGPQTRVNSSVQAVSQGQVVGRCRVSRRAEDAITQAP